MPALIRLTVHPGEDVLLPAGVRFATLLGPLADLLRRPELRHATWWCDGVAVDPGCVTGERPLLAGATLRVGGSPGPQPDDAALRSAWLVARATGADAGEIAGLDRESPLVLPGGVRVRVDRRGRVRVVVPLRGPARRVSMLRVGRRRPRRVGPGGRRWRPGEMLDDGGVHYRLSRSGDAATLLAGLAETAPGGAAGTGGPGTSLVGLIATVALPVAAPVGLAVALRQPMFALFAVVGLVAAVPQVVAAVRRRRQTTTAGVTAGVTAGTAVGATAVAGPGRPPSGLPTDPRHATTIGPTPDELSRALLGVLHASDVTWHDAVRARAAAPGGGHGPRGSDVITGRIGGDAIGATGRPTAAHDPRQRLLPDGALAVRGATPQAVAAARAVVAGLVARGASVRVEGAAAHRWAWCRWLEASAGTTAAGTALVVDSPTADDLVAAQAAHRGGAGVVLRLDPGAPVPSWCRGVVDVGPSMSRHTHPDGATTPGPCVGVDERWAERFARRVAGVRALGRDVAALWAAAADGPGPGDTLAARADPNDPRLPGVVPLLELVDAAGATGADDDAHPWAVPLGVGADGRPVTFDLVDDGPHLLVAGTTGSGKSELLQAFVLALALRRSPAEVTLALIDFKGGASLGPCANLPHVVGQVCDLDAGLAARALDGLHAELRRRKRVLATHGVADLADLPLGLLPRLVVVVDEFRALADDLPDLVPGLLRVAAQGRSLGVHLVLATQRPAGAVSADVRANVSARLALRVVDPGDSYDVVDSPCAARIAAGVPGRAVLRTGSAPLVAVQCAYAGAPPVPADTVRRAPAWPATAAVRVEAVRVEAATAAAAPAVMPAVAPASAPAPAVSGPSGVAALVARVQAEAPGRVPAWPAPWLPALPTIVHADDVDTGATTTGDIDTGDIDTGGADTASITSLPLALGDSPSTQARVPVVWDPAAGHLAVVGRARTGRTTTLRTLAHAALERGWHVHALVPASATAAFDGLREHPGFGTIAGPHSPHRATRLLRRLAEAPAGSGPVLVLVDGFEDLRAVLSNPTDDVLGAALADGAAAFAVTAQASGLGTASSRFGPRLVLLSTDAVADGMLGAPSRWAGRGSTPGRGVWLADADPVECQVVLPPSLRTTPHAAGRHARPPRPAATPVRAPGPAPVRVLPLPRTVTLARLRELDARAVGVGGDAAGPVHLDAPRGALVVGPRGSGRTTTLQVLLDALDHPAEAVVVARDAALVGAARRRGARVEPPTPGALRALVDGWASGCGDRPGAPVVLIDDADTLVQIAPSESDRLAELAADAVVTVIASTTTMAASLAHRGLLAQLRAARTGVVLAPGDRGASEVFDTRLDEVAAPGARRAGRAALVVDGRPLAVQLATPSAVSAPVGGLGPVSSVSSLEPPAA